VKKNAIIVLLFVSALILPVAGQYQATFNYTTENGLVSAEILALFVDSRGMVWTGSVAGVSSFDGRNFRNYTVEKGLWTNYVTKIFEDAEGSIWFLHRSATELECMSSILKRDGTVEILDINTLTGRTGLDLFWNKYRKKVQFFSSGELWEFDYATRKFALAAEFPRQIHVAAPISLDPFQERFIVFEHTEGPNPVRIYLWKDDAVEELPPPPLDFQIGHFSESSIPGSGEVLLAWENTFLYLDRENGWQPFIPPKAGVYQPGFSFTADRAIYTLNLEGADNLLVEINPSVPRGITFRFRASTSVGAIDRGADGTYWVATRNGLLRVFPAFMDCLADDRSLAISDLHAICEDVHGNIWLGSYSFGFSYFDGEKIHPGPDFLKPFFSILPGARRSKDGKMQFWVERTRNLSSFRGMIGFDGATPPDLLYPDTMGYYFHEAYDGQIGHGLTWYGLGITDPKSPCPGCMKVLGTDKGHRLVNVVTTVKDRYGRWWMGRTGAGLGYYDPGRDTIYSWIQSDRGRQFGVISSAMDYKGNLWFGGSNGLYFFRNRPGIDPAAFDPEKDFRRIGAREIGTSMVMLLKVYDSRTLIIGNLRGLAVLDLEAFYKNWDPVIYFFRKEDGYSGPGTEQNCVWIDRDRRVWIGSDAGAHRFDPRLFVPSRLPAFTIDSLVTAGISYSEFPRPGKGIRLRHQAGNQLVKVYLQPEFDPVRANHLYFSYKLSQDTVFSQPSQNPVIEFPNLGAGYYTLQIKSIRDGMESEVQTIEFRIPTDIWDTPMPYLLLLVLGVSIFRAFQVNRNRQQLERNKLQVQAIVNQLNPHFINNALHWVQTRVYKDEEAISVISRLGENIRLIFRNSREKKAFHSLQEEMKLVENYLYIQKKRFTGHIEFQLPTAAELSTFRDIQVPLMQVQIHCENAVEHGIRNKEEPGRVVVELANEGAYLHITIEDDGVGRSKAAAMGSKGTQQGIKMLENLRDIFNKGNPLPLIYYYEDDIFTNKKGLKHGTRVHIRIPKNYRYEFD